MNLSRALSRRSIEWIKFFIHSLSLSWAAVVFYQAATDQLGGDPVEALLHFTGISAFNLLLLCLSVSPLAKWLRASPLMQLRRLLGLYAFTFACLHLLSFVMFELQLEWQLLMTEIIKRPYITVGFSAWVILLLLAATSTKAMQRRLGKQWQKLHNWVYLAGPLIALHYIWSVKSDIFQPVVYIGLLAILLFCRKDKFIKTTYCVNEKRG
ncbi:protein-methionine-sulfoxide reductase heme-binding subunit MsrQ [Bowmanella pacifica]|uniref:Protein-methionine-sulfoxide reductase heme-binding subunit MsrQ n=1 Tax=Bowmanella pacifica TaxID=502051 RepID=A0A917YWX5_9ALTE|nr:protein-methionine-sulfoxide reductase heme-binding subunit MsrQ [Bowmanella pacifica]GGO68883.1 protein-methionine-sulfoxide reductase heme-binding subunit MsrQ [Bowmanella pacifica]